ncbi:MAG TPA: MSMEG_0565 family glycosyltransferase [Polyangiaceae bacterium]|nr:MSMEG_0565 family glycosyltransferase [Polyangiaceae bacterium]
MASIGLFTYSTKPRGSVVHATYLAEALAARGHDVTLYALSKASDRLYRELSCPVVYLEAQPAPADADSLIAQRIQEVARGVGQLQPRHDVFHAEDCLVASGLLRFGSRPLVRTLHHLEHFESQYLRDCQRRSILQADAVACVSHVSQRDVERELGRACPIIGNGVDLGRFEPNEELERWARARFELSEADGLVLSVGGVEPRKNSLRSLEAMVKVLRQRPALRWLIAGGASIWEHDDYRAVFRQRVAELEPSLRRRVVELGPVSERELSGLYRVSQILLCPSLQEGFGLCVLEALAARMAVVVANAAPFTEYLSAQTASFVDPESAVCIAEEVERLWCDAERRAAVADAGLTLARSFSWENVAVEHEKLYRALLPQFSRPVVVAREEPMHA